ncbi:hypothetical protein BDY24DRAFT_339977, partial [Mrakia frigida]|uniref:uncharacterized protein n=1 Tax=Mrakia frigida TaxID=29902 RepID=UPI003FCBFFF7
GDYFQLPPVGDRDQELKVKFAFEAEGWARTMKTEVDLKQVFRQDDLRFIKILDQMRHGTLDSESISTLKGLSREITYEDGIDPTEL